VSAADAIINVAQEVNDCRTLLDAENDGILNVGIALGCMQVLLQHAEEVLTALTDC
jgi:hypothetical protein